ncbi:MAG: hypothetical protein GXY38_14370 [Planctomycetes bacterium]|nr:hypothetical protein [Planctomycetota bacterium]
MPNNSFFARLASYFKRCSGSLPGEASSSKAASSPNPPVVVELPVLLQSALVRMQQLPDSIASLREAVLKGVSQTERLQASMRQDEDRLVPLLEEMNSKGEKQLDLLVEIQAALSSGQEDDTRAASCMNKLSEAIENSNRGNYAHVELMEQIRDRLAGSRDEAIEGWTRSARRLERLLWAMIALLAVLIAAVASLWLK